MKVKVEEPKKKRCYVCGKRFQPFNLFIPEEEAKITGKIVAVTFEFKSLAGRPISLCPSCKIQKFTNIGETLTKARYSIQRTWIVKMTQDSKD